MVRSINYYGHLVVTVMSIIIVLVAKTTESAPAVDCSSLALTMADCLSFVTSGSTVQKPEGNCCSGLKTTLKTDASCLCEGFKNSAQLGVTLNVSKALTLPAACHVSAPSISNCGLNINLNGAPAASPMASSPGSATATPPTSSVTTEEHAPAVPGSSGSSFAPRGISYGQAVPVLLLLAYFSLFSEWKIFIP